MKGLFVQNQLEFRIETVQEEYRQGEQLNCTLSVKNHSSAEQSLEGLFLHLASGIHKKVKGKEDKAFDIVSSAALAAPANIAAAQQISLSWTFELDINCTVSDKSQSLYIVCGKGELPNYAGTMPIAVKPFIDIEKIWSLIESSFSFLHKGYKSQKGWVEAKFNPPSGTLFPTLEQLLLITRFEQDTLHLKYRFRKKKMQATASSLGVTKTKSEVEQQIATANYRFPDGSINYDPLEKMAKEALATVESSFRS